VEYPLPYDPDADQEPYYPVPTAASQAAHGEYARLAARVPNLHCCGRLADYRYYNMDQALGRALAVAGEITWS
jgi:UDP-galactopyranose mutase